MKKIISLFIIFVLFVNTGYSKIKDNYENKRYIEVCAEIANNPLTVRVKDGMSCRDILSIEFSENPDEGYVQSPTYRKAYVKFMKKDSKFHVVVPGIDQEEVDETALKAEKLYKARIILDYVQRCQTMHTTIDVSRSPQKDRCSAYLTTEQIPVGLLQDVYIYKDKTTGKDVFKILTIKSLSGAFQEITSRRKGITKKGDGLFLWKF